VGGGGDDVDHFDGLFPASGDGPADLRDLPRAGEADPGGGVDDFDGASGPAAVIAAAVSL